MIKVRQFHSKNQFIIENGKDLCFQSYNFIICKKRVGCKTKLDSNYWDYSKTTGKYRNLFLGEDKKTTKRRIDSGEYKLVNLN